MIVLFLTLIYYMMLFFEGFVASPLMLIALGLLMPFSQTRKFALYAITLTLSASLVLDANSRSISQNIETIKEIGIVATEDGAIKKKGMYGFPASLVYAYDDNGLYSSLNGDVYIYSHRDGVRKGDSLKARGYFADDGFFIANSLSQRKEARFRAERKRTESFIRDRLEMLGEDEKNLSLMLLLALSDEGEYVINDLAREKGVSHVFALSGMHLSLISSMLVPILSIPLKKKRAERVALIPLFFFTFLSGFRASLLRALIFRILLTLFPETDSSDALFMTFIIHSSIFPESLIRAGAVFSYLSLTGLIAISSNLESLTKRYLNISLSFIHQSLSCLVVTIPYAVYLFGEYTLSGILYSPIINFIVSIYMGALLLYLLIPVFPSFFSLLYKLLIKILSLPYLSSSLTSLNAYYIFLSLMVLLLLISLLHSKKILNILKACGTLITRKVKI